MHKIIEEIGEFHRYAGPREMYGFVVLLASPSDAFTFKSYINWPLDMVSDLYDESVCKGIKRAMDQANILTGEFILKEISLSKNNNANVRFAFEEASYNAARKIFTEWERN